MIKKICILLVIILMILITPKAYASNNVSIESITLKEKSEDLIELSKPKINGMDLGFNLSFLNIGDKAKYEVIISNNTNKDYYIDNETKFNKSSYITYTYEFDEKVDKIKKNSKLKMYITIEYTTPVPLDKLVNGMYTEENAMSMDLSDVILTNPSTYSNIIIFIIIIITLLVLTIIKISKKKKIGINLLLIGLLLIPITTYALEKITIKAETKITVEEQRNILEARYDTNNHQTEKDFWQYANYIRTITFKSKIEEPNNYAYKFDVSEQKNNSIIAYLIPTEDIDYYYNLHIMSNGYIYANPNSSYTFALFDTLNHFYNIENYNTSFVTDMSYMFKSSIRIEELDLSHFNTSNVVTFNRMFDQTYGTGGTSGLIQELDLSNFDTSSAVDMSYMFNKFGSLKSINMSNLDNTNVTDMSNMFSECISLTDLDLTNFKTSNVDNMSYMFYRCSSLKNINLSSFDTSKVTNMLGMFCDCHTLTDIDLSNINTSNVTNMAVMFGGCGSLKEIDLSSFDTSKVTSISAMFSGCKSLESFALKIDTSNVTDMRFLFSECTNIKSIDLSAIDTSNTIYMNNMFEYCTSLTEINFGSFKTNNVIYMSNMFKSCISLKEIDLSIFDTSNVTNMADMFYSCTSLTDVDLSSFDTSNVTNMADMFYSCTSLVELDLSSFDTSKVTSMSYMFFNCNNLEKIYVSSSWTVEGVNSSVNMFYRCTKLPNYNSNYTGKSRANTSDTGYLTLKS